LQLIVPFIAKPAWCVEQHRGKTTYLKCGFYSRSTERNLDPVNTPASNIAKLLPQAQAISDILSFFILLYFSIMRLFLKKATKTAKFRALFIIQEIF
jgi:hypothetical protein